jgi:Restriction endonuclease BglII
MVIEALPDFITENYEVHEWRHAIAILQNDFPNEYNEIIEILTNFRLYRSHALSPGGRKSPIANLLDGEFYRKDWIEKTFQTKMIVDENEIENPTHGIDCYKNRVALEVEWNNKDPFYDRDLNNFRVLFEMRAISVGVIITRCSELQEIFDGLGIGKKYGSSTTHMKKLFPRIEGGGGGGCPILVFGISPNLYVED